MVQFKIRDKDFVARVRGSFARQPFMAKIGARLEDVKPGFVEIHLPYDAELTQQHGFFHGGVVGTLADNAGGFASYTLMQASDSILSIEYKLNMMAPANGEKLIARGSVIRSGRKISVAQSDIFIVREGDESLCATMLGTFMTMPNMADEPDAERHHDKSLKHAKEAGE